jgi:hypothetical protein
MMDSWPPRKIEQDRASFHAIWLRFEVSRNLWIHVLLLFFVWRKDAPYSLSLPDHIVSVGSWRISRSRWSESHIARVGLINEQIWRSITRVPPCSPFSARYRNISVWLFLFYFFFLQTCYLHPFFAMLE